jgi:ribonuclease BN (tRNA processing enzyme)
MMEIRFLGVGAAIPDPGGTNSSYLVRAAGVNLLIDCGPAVLQQLAAASLTPGDITHLFVTHRHGDHALGYPMFLLWRLLAGQGLPPPKVYASNITWESLEALWNRTYRELPRVRVRAIRLPAEKSAYRPLTPQIRMRTWPMVHSEFAPVLGLRLEMEGKAVAFTGDASKCDSVVDLASGADLLICDSCHAATVEPVEPDGSAYHLTARQAGEYAAAAGVRRLALIHISPLYAGRHAALVAEAREAFSGEVFAPAAGDVVRV